MSYAAAKLSPDAQEYVTFDPTEPTVPTSIFDCNHFHLTHCRLLKEGHFVGFEDKAADVIAIVNEIYGRVIRAIQEASFVPRTNMAFLAVDDFKNYLCNTFLIDAMEDDEEVKIKYDELAERARELEKIAANIETPEPLKSAKYFSTLAPEIVAGAIRSGFRKALVEVCNMQLDSESQSSMLAGRFSRIEAPNSTEVPKAKLSALSDPDEYDSEEHNELAVMEPAIKDVLADLFTPTGADAVETDLRALAKTAFWRAHLSMVSLARDAAQLFVSHPFSACPESDQITMSTLNPGDFIDAINNGRRLIEGSFCYNLLTDDDVRRHVVSVIQRAPAFRITLNGAQVQRLENALLRSRRR